MGRLMEFGIVVSGLKLTHVVFSIELLSIQTLRRNKEKREKEEKREKGEEKRRKS